MPMVKPTTIECGTSATNRPSPNRPMSMRTTPATSDTRTRKPWPCVVGLRGAAVDGHDAGDDRDEGGGRPVDLVLRAAEEGPDQAGDGPADDAVLGLAGPQAIANPIASGMATMATISPAVKSRKHVQVPRPLPQVLVAAVDRVEEELQPLPHAMNPPRLVDAWRPCRGCEPA